MRGSERAVALPLTGLLMVELGSSVAAPFGAQIFADLGATVLKVENKQGGDDARAWGPPFWHGAGAAFQTLNRNKLSAAIDLKAPVERDALARYEFPATPHERRTEASSQPEPPPKTRRR